MDLFRATVLLLGSFCFGCLTFADQPNSALHDVGVTIAVGTQSLTSIQKEDKTGAPIIAYGFERSSDRLTIHPKLLCRGSDDGLDYLSLLRSNKPVYPVNSLKEIIPTFPELDIRITNNSGRTLFFAKAILKVSKSVPNDEPLLTLLGGYDEVFYFDIVNHGWAAIDSLHLEFNLTRDKPNRIAEHYRYSRDFGRFTDSLRVYLYDEFLSAGVSRRLVALRKFYKNREAVAELTNGERHLKEGLEALLTAKDYGPFVLGASSQDPDGVATSAFVSGQILYSWADTDRKRYTRTIPFWTEVLLQPPEGLGAPGPITGEYEAMLRSIGENYEVFVPISHRLKNNDVSRFLIRIGIPRTSNHDLQIRFQTTDGGYVESQPITIEGLLTKSAIEVLRYDHPDFPGKSP